MLIRVQYTSGKDDKVSQEELDRLLASDLIIQFMRSSGWAVIGQDPIRQPDNTELFYSGSDRRNTSGTEKREESV